MKDFFGFIHYAAVVVPGPLVWELSPEKFEEVFEANVVAAYQSTRFAVPVLLDKKQGLAVYVGSGAARKIQPGIAVYSAAKAAEEHLSRHGLFRPWKEKGMLRSPEEAANGLLEMLDGDFRRYHGKVEESLEI